MKLTLTTFTTLDGVMQGPGAADEDTTHGFRHGGWLTPYAGDDTGRVITTIFARADAFLLGRTTYDMMYRFWSRVTDPDNVVGRALNTLPKHVVTSRPESLAWQSSHAVTVDGVRALLARPGRELQIHGSYRLAQALLAARLVEELNLWTFPVVVGGGKRLFEPGSPASAMTLVDSEVLQRGVMFARYVPAGPPGHQRFEVDGGKVVTSWES